MPGYLTERDVLDIAAYARIGLADDEVAQMTADLNAIIESLQPIVGYAPEDVEPTFHPVGDLANVMREDAVAPSFTQDEALANAPEAKDGCFVVPSILGEGGDRR